MRVPFSKSAIFVLKKALEVWCIHERVNGCGAMKSTTPVGTVTIHSRTKNNVRTTVNFRARSGIGRSNEYMIGHFVRVK